MSRRSVRVAPRCCLGLAAAAGFLGFLGCSAARAQNLLQVLPDVAPAAIGQAGAAIAPDLSATPRSAAGLLPGTTVTTRPHPEYDTAGVHVGDFYIRPQLLETTGYNSNLFADNSGRGAFLVESVPSVSFASDWVNRGVSGGLSVDNTTFPTRNEQSFTNIIGNIGGFYDIGRDELAAQYTHYDLHIARGTIDSGNFDKPIPFQIDTVHLSYLIPFSRLSFEPAIDLSRYNFQNGTFVGLPVIETANNRDVGEVTLTTRYELAPLRNLVVVAQGVTQDFTNPLPLTPTQNSKSAELLGGIDFEVSALIRVRALVGYEERTFSSSAFKTRNAPVFEGEAVWQPTQLTTVTVDLNRSIEDSLSTVTNGFTYTTGKLTIDHELLRNVVLSGHAQVEQAEFTGNQGSQSVYSAGAAATWRLNRNMSLTGSYDYADRQSSPALGNTFSQQLVLLGVSLRM